MNYNKIYQNIIDNVKKQNRVRSKSFLFESHHIIPKSISGTNEKDNLVLLTPKEHYICHRLLVEIYRGTENEHKMYYAMWCMINGLGNQKRHATTSKIYDRLRNEMFNIIKVRVSDNRKKIEQFSLNGDYIKTFDSVKEAAKQLNIGSSGIECCGREETKSSGGFNWRYVNSEKKINPVTHLKSGVKKGNTPWNKGKKFNNFCGKNTKKILQYSLDGVFIKEWECLQFVEKELGIKRGGVENCALGKTKSSAGFNWKYKDSEKRIDLVIHNKSGRKKGSIPWNKKNR
jgi:hypothetical protein